LGRRFQQRRSHRGRGRTDDHALKVLEDRPRWRRGSRWTLAASLGEALAGVSGEGQSYGTGVGGAAQWQDTDWPTMHEALGSIPSTTGEKKSCRLAMGKDRAGCWENKKDSRTTRVAKSNESICPLTSW
jgi:hypothetical protein